MNRTPVLAASIAAVIAVSAMTATVAAAAPPEFSPPFPNALTSTSKAMTLETVGGLKMKCKADTNRGEVTGPATATMTISFTGCTIPGARCQSPNGLPGEIATQRLLGTLGYVTRAPKVVGLDLSEPTGGPLIVFFCGEDLRVEVFGSVIGRLTPLNKTILPSAHIALKFAQKEGHQAIKMLLGGPLDVPMTSVLGGPLQESGIASTDLLTFAAPIKIIA
jgi:hypothetical protein